MSTQSNASSADGALGNRFVRGDSRGHILIIDDEVSILDVLREILADDGWRVTVMRTPPSVPDIRVVYPCLILLDLLFNGQLLGIQLFESIRADPTTTAIPIILCTALAHPENLIASTHDRLSIPILSKPFELNDVFVTVEAVATSSIRASNQDRWADIGPSRESMSMMNS